LCSLARFDLANWDVRPAAHLLCSTARIRRDINAASFCRCKLLWRNDECVGVVLPCFNAHPDILLWHTLVHFAPIALPGALI